LSSDEVYQTIVRMLEQAPSLGALVFLVIWQSREIERMRVELVEVRRRERATLRSLAKLPDDDGE